MNFVRCDHCTIELVGTNLRFKLIEIDDEPREADLCSAKCLDLYVKANHPHRRPNFEGARAVLNDPAWTEGDDYGRSLDELNPDADLPPRVGQILDGLPRTRKSHGFGGADAVREMQAQREKAGS